MKKSKEHVINLYFEELDNAIYRKENGEKIIAWVTGLGIPICLLAIIGAGFLVRLGF